MGRSMPTTGAISPPRRRAPATSSIICWQRSPSRPILRKRPLGSARREPVSRSIAELTSPDVARQLRETSILCLPLGAIEQHGPHLPLNTDVVIAEGLTRAIVARWGETLDLWQLP